MPKFKMPLRKDLLQVSEIMVLLTGDTSFHGQGLCSALYALLSMQHSKLGCVFIVNFDRQCPSSH